MSKPREFWIFKGDSNFCNELVYDVDLNTDVKAKPDGFYDIVSTSDTVEGAIHVVEKSSLDEANARIAELERKYKDASIEIDRLTKFKKIYKQIATKWIHMFRRNFVELKAAQAENERLLHRAIKAETAFDGLEAENERLKSDYRNCYQLLLAKNADVGKLCDERDEAKAEIERFTKHWTKIRFAWISGNIDKIKRAINEADLELEGKK